MSPERFSLLLCGMDSTAQISDGIGVAHCLKQAYPDVPLFGSGKAVLACEASDLAFHGWMGDLWDDAARATLVLPVGEATAFQLARRFPRRPEVLAPPLPVHEALQSPSRCLRNVEGFLLPNALSFAASADELHRFLRRYGWNAWICGPAGRVERVGSWDRLQKSRAVHRSFRPDDAFWLEEDVSGCREAIAFAACQGELLDLVRVRFLHEETGSAEGAVVRLELDDHTKQAVGGFVRHWNWHGGGALELVRDANGGQWIINVRSCLPSWTGGTALIGCNLPAALVKPWLGPGNPWGETRDAFLSVTMYIPSVRRSPDGESPPRPTEVRAAPSPLEPAYAGPALEEFPEPAAASSGVTPRPVLLLRHAERRVAALMTACGGRVGSPLIPAYSVKTCPNPSILALAHQGGLAMEVISEQELAAVEALGVPPADIIFNGPGKSWRVREKLLTNEGLARVGHVFADSIEELAALCALGEASDLHRDCVIGVRVRPPGIPSRFGIAFDDPMERPAALNLLRGLPENARFGVHMHMSRTRIGSQRWRDLVLTFIDVAADLQRTVRRLCVSIDVGGGGYPEDLIRTAEWLRQHAVPRAAEVGGFRRMILEPGRGLVQDCAGVLTRVLEVRRRNVGIDAVVDASIADLPESDDYPHRMLCLRQARWQPVASSGTGRVLGATCMEADILGASVQLPDDIRADDLLLILDAGAYDHSMAYSFARGRTRYAE